MEKTIAAERERHLKQNKEFTKHNLYLSTRVSNLEAQLSKMIEENLELKMQVMHYEARVHEARQLYSTMERHAKEIYKTCRAGGVVLASSIKKEGQNEVTSAGSPWAESAVTRSARRVLKAGTPPVEAASPSQQMKRSPKKTNLLSDSPEPRRDALFEEQVQEEEEQEEDAREETETEAMGMSLRREADLPAAAAIAAAADPQRDFEREARRVARRQSRSGSDLAGPTPEERALQRARRKSHSLTQTYIPSLHHGDQQHDDDKENRTEGHHNGLGPLAERLVPAATAASPRKQHRPALQMLSDTTTAEARANRMPMRDLLQSPKKAMHPVLKQVTEGVVKGEPLSPRLSVHLFDSDELSKPQTQPDEPSGRSRRTKTVNYAEPSLRVKMRRTETLPGDKRRKSSYRRVSTSADELRRSGSTGREIISIDED